MTFAAVLPILPGLFLGPSRNLCVRSVVTSYNASSHLRELYDQAGLVLAGELRKDFVEQSAVASVGFEAILQDTPLLHHCMIQCKVAC